MDGFKPKVTTMKAFKPIFLLGLLVMNSSALAITCELHITGDDRIRYDRAELVVDADCTEVTLTLEHVGSLPVEQMGHNWTLTRTVDWKDVAQSGQGAGVQSSYLPPGDKRIIAHTDLVGGGESTSVTFDVSVLEKGSDYTFFCSFPGHWAVMNGKMVFK